MQNMSENCSQLMHDVTVVHVLFSSSDRLLEHVSIALVGKYTKLADAYTSVIKSLEHSALAINHKLEVKVWKKKCDPLKIL